MLLFDGCHEKLIRVVCCVCFSKCPSETNDPPLLRHDGVSVGDGDEPDHAACSDACRHDQYVCFLLAGEEEGVPIPHSIFLCHVMVVTRLWWSWLQILLPFCFRTMDSASVMLGSVSSGECVPRMSALCSFGHWFTLSANDHQLPF